MACMKIIRLKWNSITSRADMGYHLSPEGEGLDSMADFSLALTWEFRGIANRGLNSHEPVVCHIHGANPELLPIGITLRDLTKSSPLDLREGSRPDLLHRFSINMHFLKELVHSLVGTELFLEDQHGSLIPACNGEGYLSWTRSLTVISQVSGHPKSELVTRERVFLCSGAIALL
ncbi:hypothetical protein ACFE04_019683 [Oxalis oulophora]